MFLNYVKIAKLSRTHRELSESAQSASRPSWVRCATCRWIRVSSRWVRSPTRGPIGTRPERATKNQGRRRDMMLSLRLNHLRREDRHGHAIMLKERMIPTRPHNNGTSTSTRMRLWGGGELSGKEAIRGGRKDDGSKGNKRKQTA